MTLRGMIRITAIGTAVILASAIASSIAKSQTPQVWVERPKPADTTVTVTPDKRTPILFGFSRQVVDATNLPQTAPRRAYCVTVREEGQVVFVDSLVSDAEPELPACAPGTVVLAIRPTCELSVSEHTVWTVDRPRPVILMCGVPPEVYLFSKRSTPLQKAG